MKTKNNFFMLMIALLVVSAGLVSFSTTNDNKGYDIGDVATDFKLKNVDGKMVSLADYKDVNGYIVIFSCNTCPYVVAYEDRMIELHNAYNKKGFPVIAINPNDPEVSPGDSFEKMQERAKEKNFPFAYVFDEKQEIFPQYGATRTPQVYLLEKTNQGNVVRYIGAIDDNFRDASAVKDKFLEDAIDAILNKKDVPVKTTRAIGCTIKVKS
jgi:peroxiredoxin